ncbi:MAG TPA: AAA family ATPase [Candidatus Sulfotelmatobacter sp.]|nr:AAA family ATPase [Candidatus Sulfotelmatobacter sp.]
MPAQLVVCKELIGRRAELETLVDLQRAAARGHGALVLLGGDAGIGKTRLLRALRETVSNGRAAVGSGAFAEFANLPYAGVVEALRALGAPEPLAAAGTQAEQLAALQAPLDRICARRNVVVVLEDMHWADEATFAFLQHLARSVGTMRLLVVATYRTDEIHAHHPLAGSLARLQRVARRLDLPPLDGDETRALIRGALGERRTLTRRRVEEIVERSDGNPFFVEELLEAALAPSGRRRDPRELPLTVRAAVLERLAKLDEVAREVLSFAAVIGRRFAPELLAAVAQREAAEVLQVLRAARDLQLVEELPGPPVGYAFRHALTRETIYGEMLLPELRPLHRRILDELERRGEDNAAELGWHAWSAREDERCVRYNERAGDVADALHGYADAIVAYERALDGVTDDLTRARLLEKAGIACTRDGQVDAAVRLHAATADAYARAGAPERLPAVFQRLSAELRLAGEAERAVEVLEAALATVGPEHAGARAMLRATLAMLHLDRGEREAAEAQLQEARDAEHDRTAAPIYWNALCYAATLAGDTAALRERTTRYLDAVREADPDRRVRARLNAGVGYTLLGLDEDALALLEPLVEQLERQRLTTLAMTANTLIAQIHLRAGRFALAREVVERSLASPEPNTIAPLGVAAVALALGVAMCDEELIARALPPEMPEFALRCGVASALGRFAGPYARWRAQAGERGAARAYLNRALDTAPPAAVATDLLLAAAELGDRALRHRAIAAAAPLERGDAPWFHATLALLAAFAGAHDGGAAAAAREAEARCLAGGWRYLAARCAELAGERDRAGVAFRAMGAIADLRRLASHAAAPTAGDRGGLSPREWEIATLVAAGTSNKELAGRLAVSQKTVEKHLTSIYDKLGFRSRSELAAFIARRS